MAGIISYGFYVPKFRIKTADIASAWSKDGLAVESGLGVMSKAVSGQDEDSMTMGLEAASMALSSYYTDIKTIKNVILGSETPVYAVNPTATIIADYLGFRHDYLAYDVEFACRAATAAMANAIGGSKTSLIISADKATGQKNDSLEYTAGSGATAFVIGSEDVAVEILDTHSTSTNTPDFWRRSGQSDPSHAGRFSGVPAYFNHVIRTSNTLLAKTELTLEDFKYAVFHMPNAKFPTRAAKQLGFTPEQYKDGLVVETLGNSYTSSALMGLCRVLSLAQPGDKIFFCSYGSGAGSDAMVLEVTDNINKVRKDFDSYTNVKNPEFVDYLTSLKFNHKI